jgi:hypothetical protein
MESITMSRIFRTALIVCVVGVATESRGEDIFRGTLHYWQSIPEVGTEYKEGDNFGGKLAEYSMNGIEKAIETACNFLSVVQDPLEGLRGIQKRGIELFVENKGKGKYKGKGHSKYNDGSPEAQNFVVMVVKLASMITPCDEVKACCNGYLEEGAKFIGKKGKGSWWRNVDGEEYEGHDPIADCELYIKGFKLDEYLKDVRGTIYRMSTDHSNLRSSRDILNAGGPEIDAGPRSSNFAAACQVIARFYINDEYYMSDALRKLDVLIAQNEGKRGNAAKAAYAKYTAQRAAVRISLIAVPELKYRLDIVDSKLIRRMVQGAINEGSITAEENPADIVEKIAKIMDQNDIWRHLSAQEVFKDRGLEGEKKVPRHIWLRKEQERQARYRIPQINCQNGIIDYMNTRGEEEGVDNERPLMFGLCPMIRVTGCQLNLSDRTRPESGVVSAIQKLFDDDKIPQRFEWNDDKWQKRDDPARPESGKTAYRLMSAIIRTKWDGADEYLYVHWPYNKPNQLVRGKRWIDAFDAAIKAGEKPSLGEVCALLYDFIAPKAFDAKCVI